jgi:hypothetical protein
MCRSVTWITKNDGPIATPVPSAPTCRDMLVQSMEYKNRHSHGRQDARTLGAHTVTDYGSLKDLIVLKDGSEEDLCARVRVMWTN